MRNVFIVFMLITLFAINLLAQDKTASADQAAMVANLTVDEFSKGFADKTHVVKEDMYTSEVRVDGDLASVWGRYVFFVDGKVSHCGIDAFHLVRTDGIWKIGGIASTIDAGGCTEAEKARKMTPEATTMKPN